MPEKAPSDNGSNLVRWHGFWIALLLITSLMAMLTMTIARGEFEAAKDLAGIFSGGIAAIMGFYFLQNQTQQIAQASGRAETTIRLAGGEDPFARLQSLREANATLRANLDVLEKHVRELHDGE